MNLARFLLARLEEEEVRSSRFLASAKSGLPDPALRSRFGAEKRAMSDRLLADYEAKRQFIKMAALQLGESDRPPDLADYARLHGLAAGYESALRFLALPYSDHPDYRKEWRP